MVSFIKSPLLNNFIIQIVFQIYAFIEVINQSYLYEISQEVGLTIEYIYNNYPRSEIIIVIVIITSCTFKRLSIELSNFSSN